MGWLLLIIALCLAGLMLWGTSRWLRGTEEGFTAMVLPIIAITMFYARSMTGYAWTPGSVLLGSSIGLGIALIPGFIRVMIEEYRASAWRKSLLLRRSLEQVTALIAEEHRSRNSWGYRTGRRYGKWLQWVPAEDTLHRPPGA